MSRWICTIFALAVTALLSAQPARLDATVSDPSSKPLPDAALHLVPKFGSPDRYEGKANEAGEIRINAVVAGTYVLSIKAPRFVELLREIRLAPGEETNLGKLKLDASSCGDPDLDCTVPESQVVAMPVCTLLQNVKTYSSHRVVVVGWLTTEGTEVRLGGDCDFKLITAGSVWPNAIAVSGLPPSFQLSLSKQVAISGVLKLLSSPLIVDCTTGHLCSYSYRFHAQAVARLEQATFQTTK